MEQFVKDLFLGRVQVRKIKTNKNMIKNILFSKKYSFQELCKFKH